MGLLQKVDNENQSSSVPFDAGIVGMFSNIKQVNGLNPQGHGICSIYAKMSNGMLYDYIFV